jgi:hypothetical protein
MILWEIATRTVPYKGANADVVRLCVQDGEREETDTVGDCPEGYMALVERCWHQNPSQRPQIDHVIEELSHIKKKFQAFSPYSPRPHLILNPHLPLSPRPPPPPPPLCR